MEKTYKVIGMSCSACAAAVEKIVSRMDDVEHINVNLVMNQATLNLNKDISLEQFNEKLKKGGFAFEEVIQKQEVHLDIEGMSCSSCSAALERILNRLDGVDASVNLLSNCADITYDPKLIKLSQILVAIEKGGYRGVYHVEEKIETKGKKSYKIYIVLGLALLLLYIGMSHMLGSIELPLPSIIHYKTNPVNFAMIQFVLATIILIFGYHFFTRGIKALIHGAANMDSLVAVGTGSAYLYSLYSFILMLNGNLHAMHQLYFESAGVVVALVMFGKHLEAKSKNKTFGAIRSLLSLKPSKTLLYKNGEEIEINIEEVVVDDCLIAKAGEIIASDGVIVEGNGNIDESMLTGESMPIHKQIGDKVIGGTINLDGRILFKVTAIEEDTMLSKIIEMVEHAQSKKAPIARIADQISLYFVPTVMIIALVSALAWYAINHDVTFSLTIFVSVMVIACPCALGLATPTAIMVGTGKAASMGIFIKSGEALEQTHSIDTVVFDKTGTLTIGKPVVTDIIGDDQELVLKLAASVEQGSLHPLAKAIESKASDISLVKIDDIVTLNGRGISGKYLGKDLFVGNLQLMIDQGVKLRYHELEMKLQMDGKTLVWVSYDGALIGMLGIADEIKANAKKVVDELKQQGIDVIMMSGDHQIVANAIAAISGIDHVLAQVLPDQKGNEIKKLQAQGRKVAMVGDGINDAVALSQSDVGIAIGSGSDIAIESADIVLVKDNLEDVSQAIRLSKAVIRNIKQNLFWAFFYNSLGIPIAAGALYIFGGPLLSPIFAGAAMAFSSVSVVSNALRLRNFK
ncbi:MAG: heavy metal translocating P-type ATPase [Erysipelotrichaceae bacterium]